jgi:DNA-directed RNA polymerase omega subunit
MGGENNRRKRNENSRQVQQGMACFYLERRSALITLQYYSRENPMKLIEGFDSNYRYILVAARRARQLQSGAPPVVDTSSRKPCRIAQDEIPPAR